MNNKIKYSKIVSITKLGKRRTYDISVDDNHNFLLGNRILSHNSQDLTIFGRLTGEADKEAGTKQRYRDNLITRRQIQDMSTLSAGEYYFAESGKKTHKRYLFLPRTLYWKKGYGNFYEHIWTKLVDKWTNVENVIEELDEEFKVAKTAIIEEERKKRELLRLKKESDDLKAEEKKQREFLRKEKLKLEVKRQVRGKIREKTDLELTADDVNLSLNENSKVTTNSEDESEETDENEDTTLENVENEEESIKSVKDNIKITKLKSVNKLTEKLNF